MLESVLESLEGLSSFPWFPLVVLAIAALDAVFPVVPSETLVIVGGAAAAFGDQHFLVVAASAAAGAFIGDATSYALGRSAGNRMWRRAGDRLRKRLVWAGNQLETRGAMFIVTARFIPGGRTAVTLASGLTAQPHRRFLVTVGVAVVVWALYGASIGYVFGSAFADDHSRALLWAFAMALGLAVGFEVVRRIRDRRLPVDGRRADPPEGDPDREVRPRM
jgi:membrane-associated protein